MNIGQRIKEIATSKNVSARELGERIGRTKQSMYDIYSQKVSVSTDLLGKIARALDVPVIYFFVDSEDALHDMVPFIVPMPEIHKLMKNIHELAEKDMAMVNLSITKSPEGMFLFDYEFRELKQKLTEKEMDLFRNRLNVSELITFQTSPWNDKK